MQKNNHGGKMVAPIVIAVLCVMYYCFFAVLCFTIQLPFAIGLIMGMIALVFAGVVIYVLVERIKEIRSGVEDDLSKY